MTRYIRIECLEIEMQVAVQIAKLIRRHLPDVWVEIKEAMQDAKDSPMIDDSQRN